MRRCSQSARSTRLISEESTLPGRLQRPGGLGHAVCSQPPPNFQHPGMRQSSVAARAAGMMKSLTSRITVRRSGSSVNSGSRLRINLQCRSIWGSSENSCVRVRGRSRGMADAHVSKVGQQAAYRLLPNLRISKEHVLAPHFEVTADRCRVGPSAKLLPTKSAVATISTSERRRPVPRGGMPAPERRFERMNWAIQVHDTI